MDTLTTAIIAAIAGSGSTFLLTKSPTIARFLKESRPWRWTVRRTQNLKDEYGVKRTRKIVRNWFGTERGINHLNINSFERARQTREQRRPQVRTFSFMNMKQPRLAPKLDDHYIAAAIEDLCRKGTLVKLPEPQIGGGYSHAGCQPSEPKTYSIRHFGGSHSDARKRETEAETERRCIECHYWPIVDGCPKGRYSFQGIEEEKEDRTIYRTKIVENDQAGTCLRCWEKK